MRVKQKALTFDDVLLVPAHSTVLPRDVSLVSNLTRNISLNIPVVVFREETERKEGLKSGTIVMGGVDEKNIYEQCKRLLEDEEFYKTVALAENPYGNGNSRHIILDVVEKYLLGESLGDI